MHGTHVTSVELCSDWSRHRLRLFIADQAEIAYSFRGWIDFIVRRTSIALPPRHVNNSCPLFFHWLLCLRSVHYVVCQQIILWSNVFSPKLRITEMRIDSKGGKNDQSNFMMKFRSQNIHIQNRSCRSQRRNHKTCEFFFFSLNCPAFSWWSRHMNCVDSIFFTTAGQTSDRWDKVMNRKFLFWAGTRDGQSSCTTEVSTECDAAIM